MSSNQNSTSNESTSGEKMSASRARTIQARQKEHIQNERRRKYQANPNEHFSDMLHQFFNRGVIFPILLICIFAVVIYLCISWIENEPEIIYSTLAILGLALFSCIGYMLCFRRLNINIGLAARKPSIDNISRKALTRPANWVLFFNFWRRDHTIVSENQVTSRWNILSIIMKAFSGTMWLGLMFTVVTSAMRVYNLYQKEGGGNAIAVLVMLTMVVLSMVVGLFTTNLDKNKKSP
jgi:hypothetical protein